MDLILSEDFDLEKISLKDLEGFMKVLNHINEYDYDFGKGDRVMNAQEAIEKIEQELAQIDDLIEDRNRLEWGGYIGEEQRMKDEAEYNEIKTALSIVLESAKLLHNSIQGYGKDGTPSSSTDVYIQFWDDCLFLTEKQIKEIGIEEGADE